MCIMTSNINFRDVAYCLVCNKVVKCNAVSIHSGLARRSGSIHDQISEIVGNEDITKACEISEVLCPMCLKLLLSINNVEFELKNLKLEFLGIFHSSVKSRKAGTEKLMKDSKLGCGDGLKSELWSQDTSEEKAKSKCNISRSGLTSYEVKSDKDCFYDASIIVDSIKASFVENSSFNVKDSTLCVEENQNEISPEREKPCNVISVSNADDSQPQKEIKQSMLFLKEDTDPLDIKANVMGETRKENSHGGGKHERINGVPSPNTGECLEENLNFDFEAFEIQLCSADVEGEAQKRSSAPVVNNPRKKSNIQGTYFNSLVF